MAQHKDENQTVSGQASRYEAFLLVIMSMTVLSIAYAVFQIPGVLRIGVAYQMGQYSEDLKNYVASGKRFAYAETQLPNSAVIKAHLLLAAYENDNHAQALRLLRELNGRRLPAGLAARIKKVESDIAVFDTPANQLKDILGLYGREELEQTLSKLQKYQKSNPEDVLGAFYLANLFFDLERYKDAATYYEKAVELRSDFKTAWLNLAATYRQLKNYDKAVEACKKARESNHQYARSYAAEARIAAIRNNREASLALARKAYSFASEDKGVLLDLAYTYEKIGMKSERDQLLDKLDFKSLPGESRWTQ